MTAVHGYVQISLDWLLIEIIKKNPLFIKTGSKDVPSKLMGCSIDWISLCLRHIVKSVGSQYPPNWPSLYSMLLPSSTKQASWLTLRGTSVIEVTETWWHDGGFEIYLQCVC